MEKGLSFETKYISKSLESAEQLEIQELVLENKSISPTVPTFTDELNTFYETLKFDDAVTIRRYTGYDFININAILRDNWTYDKNGRLSEDKKKELLSYAESFSSFIKNFPETKESFMTYMLVRLLQPSTI